MLFRSVGLTALAYAVVHFVLYIVDQKFALGTVASEIVSRIYLTIGFVALLAFAVLGATSTDNALKRLGRRWKHIHRLTYPATALGLLHFFMQTKLNVSEPTFVAGLYAWEMLWRAVPTDWQRRVATFPILAVAAGIATMWGIQIKIGGVEVQLLGINAQSCQQSACHSR